MAKSKRFANWLKTVPVEKRIFGTAEEFDSACFVNGQPNSYYIGDFHGKKNCAQLTNFYIVDSKAKIVQDFVITKAFYIRDRSCVESLKGTGKEILDIATRDDLLWLTPCGSNSGASAFLTVIYQALAEARPPVPPESVDKLIQNAKLAQASTELLVNYKTCAGKNMVDKFAKAYSSNLPADCN